MAEKKIFAFVKDNHSHHSLCPKKVATAGSVVGVSAFTIRRLSRFCFKIKFRSRNFCFEVKFSIRDWSQFTLKLLVLHENFYPFVYSFAEWNLPVQISFLLISLVSVWWDIDNWSTHKRRTIKESSKKFPPSLTFLSNEFQII